MNKHLTLVLIFISAALCGFAKSTKTVEGTSIFYIPPTMSLEQAEEEAIRRAKIDALNKTFGNTIGVSNTSVITEKDERFYSNGFEIVRGEWIETIGKPEIKKRLDADEIFLICKIKGKAREKNVADIDLSVKILRNGTTPDCESSEFYSGNKMYLHFISPINGYISIYQHDPVTNLVYCLLPYRHEGNGSTPVEHDKEYIFFSKEKSSNPRIVDEYKLGCTSDGETNTIYVLFSTNMFSKIQTKQGDKYTPRSIGFEEFNTWKAKCQVQDISFIVITRNIIIRK